LLRAADAGKLKKEDLFQISMPATPVDNTVRSAVPDSAAAEKSPFDPFNPLAWELPVICKDCDKEFKVPYRHFQAGVVFHCPNCRGSYVPTLPMYQRVHDKFEAFFARIRHQREAMRQRGADEASLRAATERELVEFEKCLRQLARELRPAGKMVRRKGWAAMFT
jgi:hypothetical protein